MFSDSAHDRQGASLTSSTANSSAANSSADEPAETDEGPGCFPAVLAASSLLLMLFFIGCAIGTWFLFQKRTEIAVRTLRSDVIPEVQQSNLPQEEKAIIIPMLQQVVEDGESGELENWQASGIMQRLVRSPILEWGDLLAVEAMIEGHRSMSEQHRNEAKRQLSRLQRAVELREATSVDMHDVLEPVLKEAAPGSHQRLDRAADADALREVAQRARLVADRGNIPDRNFQVQLSDIIRREIEAGRQTGDI